MLHTYTRFCLLLFCSDPFPVQPHPAKFPTLFPDDARKTRSAESGTSSTLKKKRRDPMKTLTRPENASAANVSHPVEDEISPRREKSESNNARQGRSWERAGSSINGISGFPSRARGKAIRHIFKQQPVRLCQRGGVGGVGGGENLQRAPVPRGQLRETTGEAVLEGFFFVLFFSPPCEEKGPCPPPPP